MLAYRCRHSGLLFPEDYPKQWGRLYGIGMGPVPLSEVLDSHSYLSEAKAYNGQMMRPVGVSYAGIDLVEVTLEEFEAKKAILAKDDPEMILRTDIMQVKQRERRLAEARVVFQKAEKDTGEP